MGINPGVILALAGIALLVYIVYALVTSVSCDTTLRVDENGIQLSDPCGQIDGMFQ